jgi:polyisoprenoid-binding protein YceI
MKRCKRPTLVSTTPRHPVLTTLRPQVLTTPRQSRGRAVGRGRAVVGTAVLCLLSLSATGYAALSAPASAQVTFQVAGPAGMKIEGTTSDFRLTEDSGNLILVVPLAHLTTGISLRDKHMKDDLEVAKYPEASLTIARGALKLPAGAERAEADAPATLTLHGQTKPVSVHYDAKAGGGGFTAHGKIHFSMTDFGINVPSYLGVTVKPETDVNASFKVTGS